MIDTREGGIFYSRGEISGDVLRFAVASPPKTSDPVSIYGNGWRLLLEKT